MVIYYVVFVFVFVKRIKNQVFSVRVDDVHKTVFILGFLIFLKFVLTSLQEQDVVGSIFLDNVAADNFIEVWVRVVVVQLFKSFLEIKKTMTLLLVPKPNLDGELGLDGLAIHFNKVVLKVGLEGWVLIVISWDTLLHHAWRYDAQTTSSSYRLDKVLIHAVWVLRHSRQRLREKPLIS